LDNFLQDPADMDGVDKPAGSTTVESSRHKIAVDGWYSPMSALGARQHCIEHARHRVVQNDPYHLLSETWACFPVDAACFGLAAHHMVMPGTGGPSACQ